MSEPATPTPGETPAPTEPKTLPEPTPAVDPAVEEANKRAAQAEMRANQLANQLKEQADAKAEAEAEKLKEQNQYKDLYEQSESKRKELEAETEKAKKDAEVKSATDTLFADYPDQVKEIAQETGLTLPDTDEDSIAAFKAKLDRITPHVTGGKVTPNNPGTPTPVEVTSNQDIAELMKNPVKFEEYLKKNSKGIAANIRKQPTQ